MDDDDCGSCLVESCVYCLCDCCCSALNLCSFCGSIIVLTVALICVLVAAFGVVYPVRAAVKDASVSRLALTGGANGTALSYDLSVTVSLRNRNWAMRAEHAAPLDAELLFAGRRLEVARLADEGMRIDPRRTEEFRMLAVSGFELRGDEAAEFARETVAGVVEFELRLTRAFKYRPVHAGGSRRLDVKCPLKLPVAPPPSPASPGTTTHFMSTVLDKVSITCY